ncbi:flowering time control protein FPA [Euphorbia lathyris]|uniref:flowering time control protein FPA n=1 Tax=Euphorbia lathyris TaxID=212925 RepID=UPI0033131C3F
MAPPIKLNKVGHKDSDESDAPSNNLWVGNLAADVTDSDLMGLFAKYGALDSVTSYSSRSYAFVYFKRVEDAAAAKNTLQGTMLRGNSLRIEFARPAKPCKHLWVGGISPAVSKEQLKEEFLKFGKIEDFKFNRERNAAFIEFVTLEDAFEAMRNMNGKRIGGDQIRVDFLRSLNLRRDPLPDFRDPKDGQFSAVNSGMRRLQPSGGRKEGPPSNVLWVGYPPSLQIDQQMLHNAMILFGEIERIRSFPLRNYSFVEFRSVDEARRAKEGLQGRLFNDPRISIMYSSSELAPPKEFSSFHAGIRGPRPEILNEHLFGSSHLEMLDHHRSMGLNTLSGPLPPGSIHRPNLPVRPFVSQCGFDPVLSGSEFNDLAPMRNLRDGNSNIPMGSNWRRPPSPGAGILPSPASRMKRPVSTGWDVLDPNQYQREPKRSRIDAVSSIDDDSFPTRKIDDRGLSLDKTFRFAPVTDAGILGPFVNNQRKNSLSPVGGRATVGSNNCAGNDDIWRGMIAKGGTPVCHARCVPFDKGTEIELPEVVNCSARTGLEMLAKHCAQAIGFDVVFFLPDSEDDFDSYTEFLHYLGSKDRAGVAKFDDGTTLFLVPPSDFLTDVLKVKGPERLYGVVLKLPQQVPSSASAEPQLRQPNHFPQYTTDRHPIPPFEADYNQIAQKEEQMPMNYNKVFHEETKPPSKSMEQSFPQDYTSNNTAVVSQAGVSLTPELMATIASFLPATAQSAALEGGQQIPGSSVVGQHLPGSSIAGQQMPGSSVVRPPFSSFAADKGTSHGWNQSGNPSHLQYGSQFNSQSQIQSPYQPYQPYPPIPNAPNVSENMIHGGAQIQDSSVNIPHHGGIQSRPLGGVAMTSQGGQVAMTSQGGQIALSPQVSQQYPVEHPHLKSYGGMAHATDNPSISYSPSVIQQPSNPVIFSNQAQPGMSSPAEKVNWEIPNQGQQFQTDLSGSGQGTSEVEGDQNQRYQSTLQFAASLLLQIQQQQAGNAAARVSGNQQ